MTVNRNEERGCRTIKRLDLHMLGISDLYCRDIAQSPIEYLHSSYFEAYFGVRGLCDKKDSIYGRYIPEKRDGDKNRLWRRK